MQCFECVTTITLNNSEDDYLHFTDEKRRPRVIQLVSAAKRQTLNKFILKI